MEAYETEVRRLMQERGYSERRVVDREDAITISFGDKSHPIEVVANKAELAKVGPDQIGEFALARVEGAIFVAGDAG
jgi:hypothetical protein